MTFCAVCGKKMDGPYCSTDGWTAVGSRSDHVRTVGPQSPGRVDASGPGAVGVHYGDTIYGAGRSQTPATRAVSERPWGKTLPLRVVAALGAISSVFGIVGFDLGDLSIPGVAGPFRGIFDDGLFAGSTPEPSAASMLWFAVSVLVAVVPSAFLAAMQRRGYVWALNGSVFRRKQSTIVRTRVLGDCPATGCTGRLRLARVTVGERRFQKKDSNGQLRDVVKPQKDVRLICNRTDEHTYRFDPVRLG